MYFAEVVRHVASQVFLDGTNVLCSHPYLNFETYSTEASRPNPQSEPVTCLPPWVLTTAAGSLQNVAIQHKVVHHEKTAWRTPRLGSQESQFSNSATASAHLYRLVEAIIITEGRLAPSTCEVCRHIYPAAS